MPADVGTARAVDDPDHWVPLPALGAPSDELLELTHALRNELLGRGEFLPSPWVEDAATDLKSGRLKGWVLQGRDRLVGLGFFSPRPGRAYGHVHIVPGPEGVGRAESLLARLHGEPSVRGLRLDIGLTGLTREEEEELRRRLSTALPQSIVVRHALEARLPPPTGSTLPEGLSQVPVRSIPLRRLAELDWHAFQGTPDETLAADTVDDDAHVLEEILRGLLGRFIDEASTALVTPEGHLEGVLMTAEQTPRRAIFLDLVVRAPSRRRGMGTFLLAWGMRALTALGYESVRLWVTESNTTARRLYDRLGFEATGRALIVRYPADAGGPGGPPQPHRSR